MKTRPLIGSVFILIIAGMGLARASGFALSELSIAGLSEGDALVANTTTLGALAYNPAAMAFHDSGYNIGLFGIYDRTEVTPAGGSGAVSATTPSWETLPNLFGFYKISSHIRFGLGVNEPYGLQISWPAQTFPELAVGPGTALAPTYTAVRLFDVSPSLSYRMGPVAIDVGADYYDTQKAALQTPAASMTGSGEKFGGHIGFLAQLGQVSFGANYRSATNILLNGTLSESGGSIPINTVLHLPWQFALGVHDAITPKIGMEFDFDRTGWNRFTDIVVTTAGTGGAALTTSSYNWQPANAYRLGLEYALSEDVQLRAGYAYDETGATNTDFSARIPDANRQDLSFGASQRLGAWSLSAGYMYVHFDTRTYTSGTLPTTDPNGTSAYNGTYKTHAQLFGVSISRRFS
ncbi:MAG TPA: outer membrane protein transport protein [Acidiferrobacter sp.]|nr:outer membrane protein transport protein [Acidiferrobacter sp.]